MNSIEPGDFLIPDLLEEAQTCLLTWKKCLTPDKSNCDVCTITQMHTAQAKPRHNRPHKPRHNRPRVKRNIKTEEYQQYITNLLEYGRPQPTRTALVEKIMEIGRSQQQAYRAIDRMIEEGKLEAQTCHNPTKRGRPGTILQLA